MVAEQRDDAAARRRGLLAQLIEAKDHADAVAPPVDVIAQDDQQLSRLCAVPDDAVFALALDEIRNHEELIELFQPPMDVADRPERVEIGAKLLGGERHPGRGRRKRTGRLRARRACREASSKDDCDRALHCRSIPLSGVFIAPARNRRSASQLDDADLVSVRNGAVPMSSQPPSGSANASAESLFRLASAAATRAADLPTGSPSTTT